MGKGIINKMSQNDEIFRARKYYNEILKDFTLMPDGFISTENIFAVPFKYLDTSYNHEKNEIYNTFNVSRLAQKNNSNNRRETRHSQYDNRLFSYEEYYDPHVICPDNLVPSIHCIVKKAKLDKIDIKNFLLGHITFSKIYKKASVRNRAIFNKKFIENFNQETIEVGKTLLKRLSSSTIPFNEIMSSFAMSIIFNEIIGKSLNTKQKYYLRNYSKNNDEDFVNNVFKKFNNLNIDNNVYTNDVFKCFFTTNDLKNYNYYDKSRNYYNKNKTEKIHHTIYSLYENYKIKIHSKTSSDDLINYISLLKNKKVGEYDSFSLLINNNNNDDNLINFLTYNIVKNIDKNIKFEYLSISNNEQKAHVFNEILVFKEIIEQKQINSHMINNVLNLFKICAELEYNFLIRDYRKNNVSYLTKYDLNSLPPYGIHLNTYNLLSLLYLSVKIGVKQTIPYDYLKDMITVSLSDSIDIVENDSTLNSINYNDLDEISDNIVHNDFTIPFSLFRNIIV